MLLVGFFLFALSGCREDRENTDEVEIMSAEEKEIDTTRAFERRQRTVFEQILGDEDLANFSEGLGNSGISMRSEIPEGPFTVFAPVNTAYDRLSPGERRTMDDATREGNRDLFNYYMVDGEMTVAWMKQETEKADGPVTLTTRQGETLTLTREGDRFILTDALGRTAIIEQGDRYVSDGVVHTIDNTLMPRNMNNTGNQDNQTNTNTNNQQNGQNNQTQNQRNQ